MDFMTLNSPKIGGTVQKESAGEEFFLLVSSDFVNFRARFKEALSGTAAVTSEPLNRRDVSTLC